MSDPTPWLSQPVQPEPPADAAPAPIVATTRVAAPQRGVPAPDRVDQLPTTTRTQNAEMWWVGTHGGAGESTLAALVPGWPTADHSWPQPASGAPARVVLVARSNLHGLKAAQAAARQWAAGLVPHAEVVGLVVIADAPGRLPKSLRDFMQVVTGGVQRSWFLPWVEGWRLGEPPALDTAPREVHALVDELATILRTGALGASNER